MKAVKEFDGREWPGSLCKFCSHFVPDIQSKHYDVACAGCKKPMGILSLDYEHHEPTEEEVTAVHGSSDKRSPKHREGWDKRHQDRLAAYHCGGCHSKRRQDGVDFAEVDTHVRHLIACDVCKKHLAWLDLPEDKSPEEQKEAIRLERLLCPGRCTDTHAEMERQIRATVVK